jgi:type VI secretion system protein ImpM
VSVLRAGLLGKIPAFGDFVRHNASDPVVEAVDSWFQEGLVLATEVLGPGWQSAFDDAAPAVYVFEPAGTGRFVAGAWVPGKDLSGRRYPFTVFVSGGRPDVRGSRAPLPAACGGFLDEALRLAVELRSRSDPKPPGESASRLSSLLDEQSIARASAEYEGFLRDTTVGEFWKSILGSFENPARPSIAAGIEAAVPRGKTARPGPGLKLPLPCSPPAEQARFASAWVDIVLRLQGGGAPPPLLYWSAVHRPPVPLFLFPARPHPRHFLPLVHPDEAGDHVWDLTGETTPSGAGSPSGPPALAEPGLTLEAALGRLG